MAVNGKAATKGAVIAVSTLRRSGGRPSTSWHSSTTPRVPTLLLEFGARSVVEGRGDDVSEDKVADFRKAVQATDGEGIAFSWIEWADKPMRDAAMEKMVKDERGDTGDYAE